jgi:hypothetical protein
MVRQSQLAAAVMEAMLKNLVMAVAEAYRQEEASYSLELKKPAAATGLRQAPELRQKQH